MEKRKKYFCFLMCLLIIVLVYCGFSISTRAMAESEYTEKNDIVKMNERVLDAVYASCRYGINAEGQKNHEKMLSMLVTTDIHCAWKRLDAAVHYVNAIPSIDCGCCLGDIVDKFSDDSQRYNEAVSSCDKLWFTVVGNHDCGNSDSPEETGSTNEVVEKFITPNEIKAGQVGLAVPYYYYDWEQYHIRLIVLYNYESPLEKKNEKYIIKRGTECYDQKQLNWFISVLNDTPSNYAVVIMQHSQIEPNNRVDCNFSQPGRTQEGKGGGCYGRASIKGDIVDAWIHGTALSKVYKPEESYAEILPELYISADFSLRGTGEFICYIVGHEHADIITRLKEYPEQITISLVATTAGDWLNKGSDLPRVKKHRSEDAITVVSFDTIAKRINLVRIGSNTTIYMVDRTMLSIPYMDSIEYIE